MHHNWQYSAYMHCSMQYEHTDDSRCALDRQFNRLAEWWHWNTQKRCSIADPWQERHSYHIPSSTRLQDQQSVHIRTTFITSWAAVSFKAGIAVCLCMTLAKAVCKGENAKGSESIVTIFASNSQKKEGEERKTWVGWRAFCFDAIWATFPKMHFFYLMCAVTQDALNACATST